MVYYRQEEYEKGIADCEKAVAIDPNFVKGWFRQGQCHYELIHTSGAPEKAIECFQKATDLDSTNSEVKGLLEFAKEELKEDNYIPVPAEQVRF